MIITADTPKTTTKTFAHWWLASIEGGTVKQNTPQQTFAMRFVFIRGNRNSETGEWELSPFSEDIKSIQIEDVFQFAEQQASLGNMQPANLLEGIISLAATVAKTQGIID